MLSAILPVRSLLLAVFVLMAGAGFMSTLISVRLEAAGESAPLIGAVATAYFAGLTVGSLRAGRVIRGVGHIRAFAAFVSLLSASSLGYAIFENAPYWMTLRFLDGLCVAGVYVCLESWLGEQSQVSGRGAVLAAYMIALYAGQALGQFLLNVSDAKPSMPFLIASILISLAVIPVALTRGRTPALSDQPAISMRRLYAISPLGMMGALTTGLMMGAFYGLGAVFAGRVGLNVAATATLISMVILGGVALQWPLGWLSDRFDRRRVIAAVFAGATLASLALATTLASGPSLLALGAVFGGLTFALYPLCVAHTNDHLAPDQRVSASGGLVLVYSLGAAIGPLGGALGMRLAGPGGLFGFIAASAGAALSFALWRMIVRPPIPEADQQAYQILPRTTPMSASLHPLAEPPAAGEP